MDGVDSDEIFVALLCFAEKWKWRIFWDSSKVDFCFPSFPVKTV